MAIDIKGAQRRHLRPQPAGLDVLGREVAARMDARLDYMRIDPALVLDAGSGRGDDLPRLAARYERALVVGLDASPVVSALSTSARRGFLEQLRRWRPAAVRGAPGMAPGVVRVQGDFNRLPLGDASVDLVWANLALPWSGDPVQTFLQWHRVLKPGGLLMFSTWGPDTLRELRAAFESAGESRRVHPFVDMHDLGDMMVGAGLADPVMDMERISLTYRDVAGLVADLRAGRHTNARLDRPRGLLTPRRWRQVRATLEVAREAVPVGGGVEDRLSFTFELVQGHAWKAAPKVAADGRSIIRFMSSRPGAGEAR